MNVSQQDWAAPETFGSFGSSIGEEGSQEIAWPEPQSFKSGLLPVPYFRNELLPAPLAPWLTDIAERIQCSPEFPTIGAIIGIAAVVGNRVAVRPKQKDNWTIIPNLWGGIVGRPGVLKSPALAETLKPLNKLEARAREAHTGAIKQYQLDQVVTEAQRKKLKGDIEKAIKGGGDDQVSALWEKLAHLENGDLPVQKHYIVNDSTVEKLGELLNENPRGLLLFRDEWVGWLRSLDKDGHENDRAFYLEAWNGDGQYTYDRIGRGTVHISSMTVSILRGIQPGPLSKYLRGAASGGKGDDGLLQRFQLLVYPDIPQDWRNVDRWPNTEAKDRAFKLYERLDTLEPELLGAIYDEGESIPYLRFTDAAQDFFNEWRGELERSLRDEGTMRPALEAHMAKYRKLMPALALLFHLLDWADGQESDAAISFGAVTLAAEWCAFLFEHAKRVYGLAMNDNPMPARQLADRIRRGDLPHPFTARDVYRKQWSGLDSREAVIGPLEILEDLGWLRPVSVQEQGRPTVQYHINPKLIRRTVN